MLRLKLNVPLDRAVQLVLVVDVVPAVEELQASGRHEMSVAHQAVCISTQACRAGSHQMTREVGRTCDRSRAHVRGARAHTRMRERSEASTQQHSLTLVVTLPYSCGL